MKLQTPIPLHKRTENLIDYRSKVFLLGSCFVENTGQKLTYFKFQSQQNPFGVLFHPKAIETLVIRALDDKEYIEKDIFFHNEQWHCYDAHSQMSNSCKETMLANLNTQLQTTKQQLKEASHVVFTLGTAWVYKLHTSNLTVANCHKVSQQHFKKELLSVKEISETLQRLVYKIKAINASAAIILTVSPIRHIKDGFVENTQSKAHLIAAIHTLLENRLESRCFYFPSYEIMMDELRDYRFYAEDMLHPNATAINYIWEKFQKVWISEDALETMEEVDSIQKGMSHRAFNPKSDAHSKFLAQLQRRKDTLYEMFEFMTF